VEISQFLQVVLSPKIFARPVPTGLGSKVARFFLVHYTKTGINVPNEHKMYQLVIKYP
jgi:hypothetical protein